MSSGPEILFERRGAAGLVMLNRPQALNALTHQMVRELRAKLAAWRDDPAVTRVVVTGAGDRAFCAGGDIRHIYDLGRSGRQNEALSFWRDEYQLNLVIKRYPKPYVALIDGIVMGGGVGVSVHGSHRVAGDKFLFAMPEVAIGFFPDVGGTWFLPRLAGEIGTYCALTADRLAAADGVAAGVATHRVPSDRFTELIEGLCTDTPVEEVLATFAEPVDAGPIVGRRPLIDRLFASDTVEEILVRLEAEDGPERQWAAATAARIRRNAPLSLKIALAQLRCGRGWSFEQCMRAEFRIVSRLVYEHDLYEGVRAAIIDKDNMPRWRPATLAGVSNADVERHFAPIDNELVLP